MTNIPENTFKHFALFTIFLCLLSFFIGEGWNHKEMNRLRQAGQTAFWVYRNSAEARVKDPDGWDPETVLYRIEEALMYKDYCSCPAYRIEELEYWRDSLINQNSNHGLSTR